jgi:hypothetical protein
VPPVFREGSLPQVCMDFLSIQSAAAGSFRPMYVVRWPPIIDTARAGRLAESRRQEQVSQPFGTDRNRIGLPLGRNRLTSR